MFSKVHTICNYCLGFIGCALLAGCFPPVQNGDGAGERARNSYGNTYTLPQQKIPPQNIQSIRLHPAGAPAEPPVYVLNGRMQLELSFDYLGEEARQFRVEISHRTADWQRSSLSPSRFLEGFEHAYLQTAEQSFDRRPTYQHVEYRFPNDELNPAVSGNYLLEIYGQESDNLLFSVPFFVSENRGTLETEIEQLFARREDGRSVDQPFSTYRYPPMVEFPQFDLSFYYAQNRFWGRSRQTRTLDTSAPGSVSFHLPRGDAFVSDYDFKLLDLRSLDADGRQILEYRPETVPPRIILRRDVQNLEGGPRFTAERRFGYPLDDRGSAYADVHFSLETAGEADPGEGIYIVGDFNNWTISGLNRMRFDPGSGLWKGRALVKQGEYAYKYVTLREDGIDDLALDNSFISASQEYITFVYFKDPALRYDRLLKVVRDGTPP